MARWRLGILLLLVCWLPLQPALAWLPVAMMPAASTAQPREQMQISASHDEMMSGCHGMAMSEPEVTSTDAMGPGCDSQWPLLGGASSGKHCPACYQLPPGLPELPQLVNFGPRPVTDSPEFVAGLYCDFIPGIPSPPPCSSLL